ncbi:hypothetical protein L6R52_28950 [Myxococcota bacterium]|nr:hypothetical protein [Myxococcota bacterium]
MTRPGIGRRNSCIRTLGFILALSLVAGPALATERGLTIELRPAGSPQIAVWLEDESGDFVDTLMVTKLVGTFGLGNRPGRADFGGGFLWPYGRREMALPVWAHRRDVEHDRLVFQDCRESSLGWHETHSSQEPFYCRPTTPAENGGDVDAITCPTTAFSTDKGVPVREIDPNRSAECARVAAMPQTSLYPPRNDLTGFEPGADWAGIRDYASWNTLDAVSRATPPAGQLYRLVAPLPAVLAPGRYVVWVEVNQEWDTNDHHRYDFFVDPQLRDYGLVSIGQPSVVWKIPVTIGEETSSTQVAEYVGYGSPDGQDGDVRAPDATITSNVPGSGAQRLLAMTSPSGDYRVKVTFTPESSCSEPEPVHDLKVVGSDYHFLEVSFMPATTAEMYEVRYVEGAEEIVTDEDFVEAVPGPTIEPGASLEPGAPGAPMTLRIDDLRPKTMYTIAIRSYDACHQASRIETIQAMTPERVYATVDACFIATAAYGTKDEPHVAELRAFRDRVLMTHELGRDAVKVYYEASPKIADVIRDSAVLRFAVRTMLGPVVSAVREIE